QIKLSGDFTEVNPRFCKITGYSESELLDLSWQDITDLDDLNSCTEFMSDILNNQSQANSIQTKLVHQNGELIKVKISISVVRDCFNTPQYYLCIVEQLSVNSEQSLNFGF
ncbi:MAG: PAS domain S-box protein, partial [Cyanobacteria bacterium J06573_2]